MYLVPPEHFWCLNIIVQYMNLYLWTISRLLVMSMISSGTPNNIPSPNHITQNHHRTLSMRTLRVRELCRPDRDTSPVNNQQRNLDAHIGSHISYEDLYGCTVTTTYIIPFVIGMLPEIRPSVSSYLVQSRYRQVSLLVP